MNSRDKGQGVNVFTRTSKTKFENNFFLNLSFFWSLSLETRDKVIKKFSSKIFDTIFFQNQKFIRPQLLKFLFYQFFVKLFFDPQFFQTQIIYLGPKFLVAQFFKRGWVEPKIILDPKILLNKTNSFLTQNFFRTQNYLFESKKCFKFFFAHKMFSIR